MLSLLPGLFGTIVGLYFGSEIGAREAHPGTAIAVSRPHLSQEVVDGGATLTLTAVVSGGESPYRLGIAVGANENVDVSRFVGPDG